MAGESYEPTDSGRWIDPQRRKDDALQRDAFVEAHYRESLYEEEIFKDRRKRFIALVIAVVLILGFAGVLAINLGGGGEDKPIGDLIDSEASAPDDESLDDAATNDPPVDDAVDDADDTTTDADSAVDDADDVAPTDGTTGDPTLDAVLKALGVDPGDPRIKHLPDAIRDLLDSIRLNAPTFARDDIDITALTETVLRMSGGEVLRVFNNSTIECGATEPFLVVCPSGVEPMPEGTVYGLGMTLAAPAPTGDAGHSFIYSAVFDADGDPANDWVFNPPFDFDLFQGTDRWYELRWDHQLGTWSVHVSQVSAGNVITSTTSAVRVAISGSHIFFFVPESEVGAAAYRLTAFGHDGFFSESDRGADVSGVDPTVAPVVPSGEPIETAPR